MDIKSKKKLAATAKRALPFISSILMTRFTGAAVRYTELGCCLVQGKGAGTGWDIEAEARVAARFIHTPSPFLMDVGANFGEWTRTMLKLFPDCSRIVMIEPQVDCVLALKELPFANKLIVGCAISDQPGSATLFSAESGWEAASLFERGETYFSELKQSRATVPTLRLDDIIREQQITSIDFMKMDIEGAELLALKSAQQSLEKGIIAALSFEFGGGNINSRTFFRDIWNFLTPLNYAIYRVLPGGRTWRIDSYYEDLEYFRGVSNYVASKIRPR